MRNAYLLFIIIMYISDVYVDMFLFIIISSSGTAIAASEYGFRFTDSSEALHMWGRVMFGAVLAFFMEVSFT